MTIIVRAINSLLGHGVKRSAQSLLCLHNDWFFDKKFNTDTMKKTAQSELIVVGNNQSDAKPYFPTRGRAFQKMLQEFKLPKNLGFVDLGSGKGKILLLAAEYGYTSVLGVEFSPELCAIAKNNIDLYRDHIYENSTIEVLCTDASEFEFSPNHQIFFMFNPFGETVMNLVAINLDRSLKENPRQIYIIYTLPTFRHVLTAHIELKLISTFSYGGHDFLLLSNQ